MKSVSDGIVLSCGDSKKISAKNGQPEKSLTLAYKDENSGEYKCGTEVNGEFTVDGGAIFVKFRSKFCSKKFLLSCDEDAHVLPILFLCTFIQTKIYDKYSLSGK